MRKSFAVLNYVFASTWRDGIGLGTLLMLLCGMFCLYDGYFCLDLCVLRSLIYDAMSSAVEFTSTESVESDTSSSACSFLSEAASGSKAIICLCEVNELGLMLGKNFHDE